MQFKIKNKKIKIKIRTSEKNKYIFFKIKKYTKYKIYVKLIYIIFLKHFYKGLYCWPGPH